MSKHLEITWQAKPKKEDFPAAESYLGLLYGSKAVKAVSYTHLTLPTNREV